MSEEKDFNATLKKLKRLAYFAGFLFILVQIGALFLLYDPELTLLRTGKGSIVTEVKLDEDRIENGIHVRTGLIDAKGLMNVVTNCTNCHSAKLVIQNRMNEERWNATIFWMQKTQNLWDLGSNQKIIVDYLVSNYPVKETGRRSMLTNIKWYELEN